jgi:hypothetical protein
VLLSLPHNIILYFYVTTEKYYVTFVVSNEVIKLQSVCKFSYVVYIFCALVVINSIMMNCM